MPSITLNVSNTNGTYDIYRDTSYITNYKNLAPYSTGNTGTSWTDTAVVSGTTYYYIIVSNYNSSASLISNCFEVYAGNTPSRYDTNILNISTSYNSDNTLQYIDDQYSPPIISSVSPSKTNYIKLSNGYLQSTYSTPIGGADFTFEIVFKPLMTYADSYSPKLFSLGNGAVEPTNLTDLYIEQVLYTSNRFRMGYYNNGWYLTEFDYNFTNQWYNLCMMRVSGTVYIFVNGVLILTNNALSSLSFSGTNIKIGQTSSADPLTMYIDGYRFTQGVARYSTSGYTPSYPFQTTGDTYFSNVKCLVDFSNSSETNQIIVDKSSVNSTINSSGVTYFNTSWMVFNGNGNIKIPSNVFENDFFIEFDYKQKVAGNNYRVITIGPDLWNYGTSIYLNIDNSNNLVFKTYINGITTNLYTYNIASPLVPHKVGISKKDKVLYFFIDGILLSTTYITSKVQPGLFIGGGEPYYLTGYLGNFQIYSYAKHTSNYIITSYNNNINKISISNYYYDIPSNSVFITGNSLSSVTNYGLYKADLSNSTLTFVKILTSTNPSFNDTNIALGKTYRYYIADDNNKQISKYMDLYCSNGDMYESSIILYDDNSSTTNETSYNNGAIVNSNIINYKARCPGTGMYVSSGTNTNSGNTDNSRLTFDIVPLYTSDFTMEIWLNPYTALSGQWGRVFQIGPNSTNGGFWLIKNYTSDPLNIFAQGYSGGYMNIINSNSTSLYPNNWYHICIMRSGGVFYYFLNGMLVNSVNNYTTYSITQYNCYVGKNDNNTEYFTGAYESIRITKGIVRYPLTGFTVDSNAVYDETDQYYNNVIALIKFSDNKAKDYSKYKINVNTNSRYNFISKNANGVSFYNGASYKKISYTGTIGYSDFTAECFAAFNYNNVNGNGANILTIGKMNVYGSIYINANYNTKRIMAYCYLDNWRQIFDFSVISELNNLNHYCIMRKNGIFYFFINGNLYQSTPSVPNLYIPNNGVYIGNDDLSYRPLNGVVHSTRITTAARYPVSGFEYPYKRFLQVTKYPTNVVPVLNPDNTVSITWSTVGYPDSYKVYRSDNTNPIATLSGSTVTYTDNTYPGGQLQYMISAVKNGTEFSGTYTYTADVYANYVTTLMHFDDNNGSTSFIDVKQNVWTQANGASISTDKSVFGLSSAKFVNAQRQYLQSSYSSNFDLIGSAFTVECWIYLNSIPSDGPRVFSTAGGLVGFNTTNGIHLLFQISGGTVNVQLSTTGGGAAGMSSTANITTGAWHHISCCWDNNIAYVSLDGVVSSGAAANLSRPSTNPIPSIGTIYNESTSSGQFLIDGYIDEFRITKGIARYKTSFTVPSHAF